MAASVDEELGDLVMAAGTLQRLARGASGRRLAAAEWEREIRGWLWVEMNGWIFSKMMFCWCVLKGRHLHYYADDSEKAQLGGMPITDEPCFATVPQANRDFCFRLGGRLLASESAAERRSWVSSLLRKAGVEDFAQYDYVTLGDTSHGR